MTAPLDYFYLTQVDFNGEEWINVEGVDTTRQDALETFKQNRFEPRTHGIRVLFIAMGQSPLDVTADFISDMGVYDDDTGQSHSEQARSYRNAVGSV